MKSIVIAMFAGSLVLSSLPVLAADTTTVPADQPKAETKTEKAKEYVKEKAHNAKEKTKRAAKKTKKKTKEIIDNRKTTDPSGVSESKPDMPPPAK
ncbi:MAG TPA: hypothetical protein VHP37_13810 [Burkholderiales bacterium]|nr:hypothetical protein [Burkholderiales bacterium]